MNDPAKCVPCAEATTALTGKALEEAAGRFLPSGWRVVEGHHLEREFEFKDFRTALDFTNRVGELAEQIGHHPDIYLTWGIVRISIWTHKVNGLTTNDFELAKQITTLS